LNSTSLPAKERERLEKLVEGQRQCGKLPDFCRNESGGIRAKERATIQVYGLNEPFRCSASIPEDPGAFFFAPIAAAIPAAARLMLALLERCVEGAGGCYAFCDTDSLVVVASEKGGMLDGVGVHALSWSEVDEIIAHFRALNPYDRRAVANSILKLEKENFRDGRRIQLYALCISAKR